MPSVVQSYSCDNLSIVAMVQASGRGTLYGLSLICAVALLVRCMVGLHPYSGMGLICNRELSVLTITDNRIICVVGAGIAPMYGDYEAQRHWMELSTHLPVSEW